MGKEPERINLRYFTENADRHYLSVDHKWMLWVWRNVVIDHPWTLYQKMEARAYLWDLLFAGRELKGQ